MRTINIPSSPTEALEEMLRVESRLLNNWADGMAVGQERIPLDAQHRYTARLQARVSALRAALYALRVKAPATLDRPAHPYTTQQEDQP
jgi:hypothetical protein